MTNLINIDITKIYPHPDNPRKDLGDLTELADSIKANGVLQNLTVVPLEADTYRVIIGHRRLAAATIAGLKTVPCVVAEMTAKEQVATMLLENMQRADLTVYEQAQGFQMMIDLGDTVEGVAEKTGFSTTTVRRRLKMTELDQVVLKDVSSRQLSLMDFDKLAQIEDLADRNKVLEQIGTSNFNSAYESVMKAQKIKKALPEAKAFVKGLKAKKIEQNETWGGKYERVVTIYLTKWEEDKEKLPKAGNIEYFYYLDSRWGELSIYKKAEKSKPVKKSSKELEKERRLAELWKRADELNELHHNLRRDFVKGISLNSKNQTAVLKGAIGSLILHCIEYASADREAIVAILGIDDTKYYPDRGMKALVAFKEKTASDYPALVYANFGDGKKLTYISGYKMEAPKHKQVAMLDALYDWLCSLGYEMSDDEIALRDGTHELFNCEAV